MTRTPSGHSRWLVPAAVGFGLVGLANVPRVLPAGADTPNLPALSPAELLAKVNLGRLITQGSLAEVQALLVVLALVPTAIVLVLRFAGGPDAGEGPNFLNQVTNNGVFAALAALTVTLPFFLPLAVSIVAGDAIAGEAGLGTLRYVLTVPAGRTRLLAAKAMTTAVFCIVSAFVVATAGLIAGAVLFPVGRVTTLSGDTLSLAAGSLRILAAAGLVGMSLLGLAAIGLFISTLTDVPVGAIAGTLGVLILSGVLTALPQLSSIHPWLFTAEWQSFGDLLRTDVQWGAITKNLEIQAGYVALFAAAAWARFTTKDILA